MADNDMMQYEYEQLKQAAQQANITDLLLNNEALIEQLTHLLKGEIKQTAPMETKDGRIEIEYWERPTGKVPPINDDGFYTTMLHISTALDKTMATGNLREGEINIIVRQILKRLTNLYGTNYVAFGLKTKAESSALISTILNAVKTHFSKSKDMGLVKHMVSSISISEQKISNATKQEAQMTM